MTPEYLYPDFDATKSRPEVRSMIQAWFPGSHIDIGGSAREDGLSLYPLQWMLLESKGKGLVLEFSKIHERFPWAKIDNPLEIIFPKDGDATKGLDPWSCTTENGIVITMQDLRKVHDEAEFGGRYRLKDNTSKNGLWPRSARKVFDKDGSLLGWIPSGKFGTIQIQTTSHS